MATIARPRIHVKHSSAPDEVRAFHAHGHAEVHTLGDGAALRGVFEPGWKWSNDVKPIAKTHSCEVAHLAYVISGRMHIKMDDGQEVEVGPGDFMRVEPGHDAWVIGNEPCIMVDFAGIDYAKMQGSTVRPVGASSERTSVP